MSETDRTRNATMWRLRWQIRLSWAGLAAERVTRAFWPVWTLGLALVSALAFGAQDALSPDAGMVLFGIVLLAGLVLLVHGIRRFRWPGRAEAVARLDAALPGRPLATLADRQAIGAGDAASVTVWRVHLARMAAQAARARAAPPDLRIARLDPFALRYVALTAFVMALAFGAFSRVAGVTALAPGSGPALAAGPVWEGWIRPPDYTGRPALYLNDIDRPVLDLPQGSRVTLRFYGEVGALGLNESVSSAPLEQDRSQGAEFEITRPGRIEITGPGGRNWHVAVLEDQPPEIAATSAPVREADGRMRQGFEARDDYGVVAGRAEITLDLPATDRRHGLEIDPEPRDPLLLDVPLPFTGDRTEVTETLVDDLSQHPWAHLPVTIRLMAEDAPGQIGLAPPIATPLPGRRFFDPLAAAIIEARRDLLWSAANAPRVAQVLRAVTHRPEGFIRNERAFLRLRVATRQLEAAMRPVLAPEVRDDLAAALWDIAVMVEQGDLASALERLRRAQDRLDEAMRNGATESEIAELMQEFRDALDNYMRQLAEEGARDPDQQMSENMQGMEMTGNQLQELLDQLQQLMEEGRMAEAAELMEMLRQLMENMQVTQGPGGSGGEGQQAMRDLAETMRGQQGLADESFRELQQPGDGEGEGEGQGLADRQRELRDRLGGLDGSRLPGEGSERGESGRRALDRAGRAMEGAEQALRDGDLPGALDRQSEALEAMREGMRDLGEALAEDMRREEGGNPGQEFGNADPTGRRDPLGRTPGQIGRLGTEENMLQGDDVYRRAQDLLEELRRRSGEQTRPEEERDYLRRLLDRF